MPSRAVGPRRWFPSHQPQTLQIAVVLLYWNAAIGLLVGLLLGGLGRLELILLLADLAGAYGVSNERRWGYWVAVVAAILPLLLLVLLGGGILAGGVFSLIFEIALVVLLLHPMSRGYYRTWFR